jgi:hypothetical protein
MRSSYAIYCAISKGFPYGSGEHLALYCWRMTNPTTTPSTAELESVRRILLAHQEVRETCVQTQRLIAWIDDVLSNRPKGTQ